MLSTSHRFLFVHVPKTAGNAIQDALRAWSDDRFVCLAPHQDGVERFELRSTRFRTEKHSTLRQYRAEYGDEMLKRLFVFTCVRNPWDRAMSHYFSPHRGAVAWDRDAFVRFVRGTVRPLRHYLAASPGEALADALPRLGACIRHEHLEDDLGDVCARLGLPAPVLQVRNRSTQADHRRFWDDVCVAVVTEHLHEEIAALGYRPPVAAGQASEPALLP